ncbi:MAG: PD-(D/E)XK nuclease-like domain-containing protein [Pseudobdellovibrionaceae bacterium]|nr:PD-(D/E)XK nuclease-like domain-containing protein [Pseudobdellovibrionaceae bacterium]
MTLEVGTYTRFQLPIAAYHADRSAISKSSAVAFDEAPSVYESQYILGVGKKESSSLDLGKEVHDVIDGSFDENYVVEPEVKSRSEKIWKDFVASYPGKTCLKPAEADKACDMAQAILNHGLFRKYSDQGGEYETTFVHRDGETGVLSKTRPDFITHDRLTIVDFKTAASIKHFKFQKAAYDFHYQVSAAFTLESVHAVTGIMPERYIFFVVQSSPPYLVVPYQATDEDLELGRIFLRRVLPEFKKCRETGIWPGLSEEIRPLGPPPYARRILETAETYSKTGSGDWRD